MQNLLYTRDGWLVEGSDRTLQAMLDRLDNAAEPKLVLFAHGGLVKRANAERTAEFLDSLAGYGALRTEGWETAYFIWHSSVAETVEINWEELDRDPLFVKLILKVAVWVEKRVGKAVLRPALLAGGDIEAIMTALDATPKRDRAEVAAELASRGDELIKAQHANDLLEEHLLDTDLADELAADEEFRALARGISLRSGASAGNLDPEILRRIDAAEALPPEATTRARQLGPAGVVLAIAVVRAAFRVLKRYLDGRDHGLWPTSLEEIMRSLYLDKCGARAWGLMKQDTRDHFLAGRAGSLLIDGLNRVAAKGKPVRLMVIGHSAGSILASHFAVAAKGLPGKAVLDLIFLAPAISISEAVETLKDQDARVDGLRIFTMSDECERANHLDGLPIARLYQRSLLYLISGVLERQGNHGYPDAPLLGLQRHNVPLVPQTKAERKTLAKLKDLLGAQADRLIYSKTDAAAAIGRQTTAETHGGYYQDGSTVKSILHIARNGMQQ